MHSIQCKREDFEYGHAKPQLVVWDAKEVISEERYGLVMKLLKLQMQEIVVSIVAPAVS